MAVVKTGFADINGAKIYYEVAGAGHPLVFVHAGIADSRMWDDQFMTFAEEYRVVRFDLRSYGKTAPVAGEFSNYQDLHGLLRFLNIDRAYLVGCSIGGMTILDFTLTYPEMAAALVLVGSGLGGYDPGGEPAPQWVEAEGAFNAGDFERVADLAAQVWVDGPKRAPGQVDSAVRDKVKAMSLIGFKNDSMGLGKFQPLDPPAAGRLAELDLPTLVIVGDQDQPDMLKIADVLAEDISGAQKVVIHDAAHVPSMETPAQFNQIVRDFLGGL